MKNFMIICLLVAFCGVAYAVIVQEGDDIKVYDEQKSKEITFKYEDLLIDPPIDIGTGGWVPGCSGLMPFSLDVELHIAAGMTCEMKGFGVTKWPEAVKLYYEGTPDGGHADMDYGIEMKALYKNCFTGEEKPLSEWLNFDLRFFDEKYFTPFLLDGNDENPVSLEDSIQQFHLWDGTLADIIGPLNIPILGNIAAMIGLSFDLDGKMYVEMFGNRIALDEKQQRSFFSDNQYIVINPPLTGTVLEVPAHFESRTYFETDLILTITIKIKILELGFTIPITLPLVKGNDEWIFNQQTVSFDFPAVFIEKRMHQFMNTMPGDEDYWEFEIENIGTRHLEGRLVSDDINFIVLPEEIYLEPGEKTNITVFFKPYEAGEKKGVIKFYSNDPVDPLTAVALFGYSEETDTAYNRVKKGEEPQYGVKSTGYGCSLIFTEE